MIEPITLTMRKYADKYRGYVTDEWIDVVVNQSNYKSIPDLSDYCMEYITYKDIYKYDFSYISSANLFIKYILFPYFEYKMNYPLYVYLTVLDDQNIYNKGTTYTDEYIKEHDCYSIQNVIEWTDKKCVMHKVDWPEDLLYTVNKRRTGNILAEIKDKIGETAVDFIENYLDVYKMGCDQDWNLIYYEISYKTCLDKNISVLLYIGGDTYYDFFNNRLENQYA